MISKIKYISDFLPLCFASVFLFLASCNTTQFLKEDEILLKKIDTEILKSEKIDKPQDLKAELIQFYQQKPNGKSLIFFPREWFYYKNLGPGDTTWIKKWRKNVIGEEPAILDTSLISKTSEDMQNYLRNKKGFYNAIVNHDIEYGKKKAKVLFTVDPKKQYTIHSLEYFTLDSLLKSKIPEISQKSILSIGDPIDALSFNVEKQRIVEQMQTNGYANFNLNYVSIKGDSTKLDHAWDIFIEILPPTDSTTHKKYHVGDIEIYTDVHQFQNVEDLTEEIKYGKKFLRQSEDFIVSPTVIDRKIHLKTNDVFSSKNYDNTLRNLFNLEAYRFIKLQPRVNPQSDSLIDYKILMTPQKNKWIFDFGTDIFFSNIARVQENLVGFAVGTGLQNRNMFGGSENYKFSFETGVEFGASTKSINTFSLGLNNSLDLPQFTRPFNVLLLGNKLGLIKDKSIRKMENEASSRITLGYNYVDILDFYRISTFATSYGYNIRFNKKHRIVFNQTGFNYANYDIRDRFQLILDSNPLLARSFEPTLFTGLLFKDLSYYYQSDNGPYATNFAFIANLEASGLEIQGFNKLSNAITNRNQVWRLRNGIDFEKFLKLELDARWYKSLSKNSQWAARFKTGIAVPYGKDEFNNDNVVSFIKQFLIGGPSSMRAWRPMELGPGDYEFNDPASFIFFQRGDLLMEFNLEYRFDLFWLLEGALFFDGGNIWTLETDSTRLGSKISGDFYKQIALGYGWGMRFDLSYFLIRFDFGYKLRSPFVLPDTGTHYYKLNGQGIFGNFNVAVNYPF